MIGAAVVFGERFTVLQWAGVAMLVSGLFGLAGYNLRHVSVGRETLAPALGFAVATGLLVALYTTWGRLRHPGGARFRSRSWRGSSC